MEPLEFEKKLKEKLSNRELEVSRDAWKRLAKQLDADQGKQKVLGVDYKFLLVAASMIGVIFSVVFYFSNQNSASQPTLVKAPLETSVDKVWHSSKDQEIVSQETLLVPSKQLEEKEEELQELEVTKISSPIKKSKSPIVVAKKQVPEVVNVAQIAVVEKDEVEFSAFSDSIIQVEASKIAAVVAQLEHENNNVTEDEIDALLAQARQDILTQKYQQQYHQNYQTVDAATLLLDVEAELDQSFKEQVFEALKTSFNKVRTAMRR